MFWKPEGKDLKKKKKKKPNAVTLTIMYFSVQGSIFLLFFIAQLCTQMVAVLISVMELHMV